MIAWSGIRICDSGGGVSGCVSSRGGVSRFVIVGRGWFSIGTVSWSTVVPFHGKKCFGQCNYL